jgi:flagellar hook-associated protein 1 FlgK
MSLGPIGTMDMATRALQVQQEAIEITGQNLANMTNPAYARQRVIVASSPTLVTPIGVQGTGAQVVSIQQIRDALLDTQIQSENSTTSYVGTAQTTLQNLEATLGQVVDTSSSSTTGSTNEGGLGDYISNLFNAFQTLSTDPTSLANRQALMLNASSLATEFNQLSSGISSLHDSINSGLQSDVTNANELLGEIATLNKSISVTELTTHSTANDLRDQRQADIEQLSQLASVTTTTQSDGSLTLSIGGVTMVSGNQVSDTLQVFTNSAGQNLVQAKTAGTTLTTGGSIQARIDVRDGEVQSLSDDLNTLASTLITTVNAVHAKGYGLNGTTKAPFFTGTDASDIGVNSALLTDPSLVQASGTDGVTGDNQVALALAQLADTQQSGLNNMTFNQSYNQTVANMGQALSNVNDQVNSQQAIQNMLTQQRESVSGVSIDEEVSNLTVYQRAYEANARVISVVDEILTTLIGLGTGVP